MSLKIISCNRFRSDPRTKRVPPGFYRSAFPGQKPIITLAVYSLTIPVSPPLMVKSKLQYFSAYPKRLINMAVNAPAAPE